jgi:hypothetical protein
VADITDPEAIKFSNELIRPMADDFAQRYYQCKRIVNEWNAKSMSAKIPNNANVIIDGSATDGRHVITGVMATAIITRAQEHIADYEATSQAKLNTVLMVAVHGE